MNSESDESVNSQTEYQLKIELKLNEILDKLNDYLKLPKINELSKVQIKQLTKYRTRLRVIDINKLTDNLLTSIENHIKFSIFEKKSNIMNEIDNAINKYGEGKSTTLKREKIKVLEQLQHELKFIPDNYLNQADSNYFINQLKLLQSGKYVRREHLLKEIDSQFLQRKIHEYPYSYIDEVNKLRLKVRRKPFIVSLKTKDKIMKKLKIITHDYYIHPSIF